MGSWIIQLPVLLFSIIVHEVAHGVVALKLGDDTARRMGRLSLSPLAHVDAVGTLIVPALCTLLHLPFVGWAKPVPVDPRNFADPRRAMMFVSLAGPASNIALCALAALAGKLLLVLPAFFPSFERVLLSMLVYAMGINLVLACFNLIPIHPLDGGKILSGLLPYERARAYDRHAPYGVSIVLALVVLGGVKYLLMPAILLYESLLNWLRL